MRNQSLVRLASANADRKLFVLDTNVLIHDPNCIFSFQDNDVYIPVLVLEELDGLKSRPDDVSFSAREVIRSLSTITDGTIDYREGIDLARWSNSLTTGHLFIQSDASHGGQLPSGLKDTVDNRILALTKHLKTADRNNPFYGRRVVLVSKDINMRIKAQTFFGVEAQDYLNDQAIQDIGLLYPGWCEMAGDFLEEYLPQSGEKPLELETEDPEVCESNLPSWKVGEHVFYRLQGNGRLASLFPNEYLFVPGQEVDGCVKDHYFVVHQKTPGGVIVRTVTDYFNPKNRVWSVCANNHRQVAGLDLLADTSKRCATIVGEAGTGKTIMAMAAGLDGVQNDLYNQVVVVRAAVPLDGKGDGFYPGSVEEKTKPWLACIWDNLEVLQDLALKNQEARERLGSKFNRNAKDTLPKVTIGEEGMINTMSLNLARGRSLYKRYIIVEEAQNLTPHQAKTLATRVGKESKIVFVGDLSQIDRPYLTAQSSGLTYLVERFKGGTEMHGHITLTDCERDRWVDFANKALK